MWTSFLERLAMQIAERLAPMLVARIVDALSTERGDGVLASTKGQAAGEAARAASEATDAAMRIVERARQ